MSYKAKFGLPPVAVQLAGGEAYNPHFISITSSKWNTAFPSSDLDQVSGVKLN